MINRFSSRRAEIHESFLNDRLRGAQAYDRIAGYFSSSILEVAGEALENVRGKVRIVCNSDLDVRDVETARAAELAIRREWCSEVEDKYHEKGKAVLPGYTSYCDPENWRSGYCPLPNSD